MSFTNEEQFNKLRRVRDETLEAVSPSFCIAKWTQSTIYLFNGHTHSCHHPNTHKIRVEDIKRNPAALHNTPDKQERRREMLAGVFPTECDYCWRTEKKGKEHLSDRTYKSASSWSLPRLSEVLESGTGPDFRPSYVEVAFESTCNFKCVYCMPHISSRWWEEIEAKGPYNLQGGKYHTIEFVDATEKRPIRHDEPNPYIDAFWKIWPEWYSKLHTFRITGGEPLLSKHTWKILDYVIAHPNPNIILAINTNLSVPDKLLQELLKRAPQLKASIKSFQVYTSLESTGTQAEYSRFGMNYIKFIQNCELVLDAFPRIDFMTTVNILSASTFIDFLNKVLDLRQKYNKEAGTNRVGVMVNYLRYPEFLDIRLLPDFTKKRLAEGIEALIEDSVVAQTNYKNTRILYLEEVDQLRRLIAYMNGVPEDANKQVKKLRDYVVELDNRRETSFLHTFPELFGLVNAA